MPLTRPHIKEFLLGVRDGYRELLEEDPDDLSRWDAFRFSWQAQWEEMLEDTGWGLWLWQVRHPGKEMYWHPDFSWRLKRWNPLFWLVTWFGGID